VAILGVHGAATAVKVTVAVVLIVMLSDGTTAVKVALPALEDLTVKVAVPVASVIDEDGDIESVEVRDEFRVTDLPGTTCPFLSLSVTVMVDEDAPSATTLAEDDDTVD
jgi:hypothetical protein